MDKPNTTTRNARQPGYEPFPISQSEPPRLRGINERLYRTLPRPVYRSGLATYHELRRLTRRNVGRGRLLPDFAIIGAAKAGTTSVYAWLCQHPYAVRARRKEIHYFSFYWDRGIDWYREHFPLDRDRTSFAVKHGRPFITGEGSPSYMIEPEAPGRMARLVPNVRLIVCLRDPVDRAYSQFQMRRRDGQEPLDDFQIACALEDPALDDGRALAVSEPEIANIKRTYLLRGRYAEHLERWFAWFPRDRVHVIAMQDLAYDPQREIARLHDFLDLPAYADTDTQPWFSTTYEPMSGIARECLQQYFAPHNERVYALLERDFGWRR